MIKLFLLIFTTFFYTQIFGQSELREKIEQITSKQLLRLANEIFDVEKFTIIRYV